MSLKTILWNSLGTKKARFYKALRGIWNVLGWSEMVKGIDKLKQDIDYIKL